MRERMERFSILRFSIGCVSQSSVDVVTHPRKSHSEPNPSPSREGEEETKSSNVSEMLQKIVKGLKSLPQVFQLHGYDEDEEEEEEEVEMVIGLPTDVQHVAHIGWDGPSSSWISRAPEPMPSFPSLSLKQFELAMAKQSAAAST